MKLFTNYYETLSNENKENSKKITNYVCIQMQYLN